MENENEIVGLSLPTHNRPNPIGCWGQSAYNAIDSLVSKIYNNQLKSLYILPNQRLTLAQYDQLFSSMINSALKYKSGHQLTTVCLGHHPIPDTQWKRLSTYIANSHTLDHLVIKHALYPYINGFKSMLQQLPPKLPHMTISVPNGLDASELTELLGLLANSLSTLTLDGTQCPSLIDSTLVLRNVQKLDLSNCALTCISFQRWMQACPELVELHLGGNVELGQLPLDSDTNELVELVNLQYLDISDVPVTDTLLVNLISAICPNIRSLKLTNTQVTGVANMLRPIAIQSLVLSRSPISPSALTLVPPTSMFGSIKDHLEVLDISECLDMTHDSVMQVLLNLPNLKSLSVRGIDLSPIQVDDLDLFRVTESKLEHFDLVWRIGKIDNQSSPLLDLLTYLYKFVDQHATQLPSITGHD